MDITVNDVYSSSLISSVLVKFRLLVQCTFIACPFTCMHWFSLIDWFDTVRHFAVGTSLQVHKWWKVLIDVY